jgi:RNA-directed DNA polymerase
MEKALQSAYTPCEGKVLLVRYADDFVIFHPTEEGIYKAKEIIERWLKDMGLELKPSKTRMSHTLNLYQGNVGFDFLGFTIRQYPVGKYRTGTNTHGQPLGFKTLIKPSKEARKRQIKKLGEIHRKNRSAPQEQLIKQLNPVIRGWSSYYRTVVSKEIFKGCDHEMFSMNRAWALRRHPNKNRRWIKSRYWKKDGTHNWIFRDHEGPRLRQHSDTEIQRHAKVKGDASPYDGNLLYWSTRLKNNPMLYGKLAKLLQKQRGKCRWCGLTFKEGDRIEIDHIDRDHDNNALSNQMAVHLHCHHNRHAKLRAGISDKDAKAEEPDEGKLSRPVLKTSMEGDFLA